MKILVTIKQVASRDSLFEIRSDGRWIDDEDLDFEVNEPDAYALEAALRLREKEGGEVMVLCLGPDRVSKAIREALAKGADRAIHIEAENPEGLDTLTTARLLAKAIAAEAPDLVLTGLQSDDLGAGQTGVVLAELLGLPHATIVVEIEKTGDRLRARRELEGGYFQEVGLPLPAVLTIQSGIRELRYATLMGIKRARSKEVKRLMPGELGVETVPGAELLRVSVPKKTKQTVMLDGPPEEAATGLLEKLRHEARVL